MNASELAQYAFQGLVVGSIYAVIAASYVMIYRSSKTINLAQAGFLVAGVYTAMSLSSSLPAPLGLAAALAIAALLGAVSEYLVISPLLAQPPVSMIAATAGLWSVFYGASIIIWGTDTRSVSSSWLDRVLVREPVVASVRDVATIAVGLCSVAALVVFVKYTSLGAAMRAVSEDSFAAVARGIRVASILRLSWAIAGLLGGIAGILIGASSSVNQSQLLVYAFEALPAALLGGLDSVPGALVGGIVMGEVKMLAAPLLEPYLGFNARSFIVFLFMLAVLLVKPYGLFGTERIERV